MKKFTITGGMACGKSTLSHFMEELGWKVIDADKIVHELYRPRAEGTQKVVDAFGKKVLNKDESVNRTTLGRLVFSDSKKLKLLNSLIHPLVRKVRQQQHSEHLLKNPDIPVLAVIPLLFETGLEGSFDSIACVACSKETQKTRLKAWKYSAKQMAQRNAAQWPIEKKMEKSQIVIWNNGSLPSLQAQAKALHERWLQTI